MLFFKFELSVKELPQQRFLEYFLNGWDPRVGFSMLITDIRFLLLLMYTVHENAPQARFILLTLKVTSKTYFNMKSVIA